MLKMGCGHDDEIDVSYLTDDQIAYIQGLGMCLTCSENYYERGRRKMGPGRPALECDNDELISEFESACRGGDYEFAEEYREELRKRLNESSALDKPFD